MVASMIVVLMLGVINFLISRLRGPSDSYRYWTAGNFLLAIGFTLLGLRGNIPMFWSAVTGNTLLIVARWWRSMKACAASSACAGFRA